MVHSIAYFNPYSGKNFLQFFLVLLKRLFQYLTGQISFDEIATDEIQMLVLIGVSCSCALVGSFLVLRRMTMLANAMSHTILIGIVIAYLLTIYFGTDPDLKQTMTIEIVILAALITGLLTTFLTEFLTKNVLLQEDASIGIVFTTLFALGIILITLFTKNIHVGTELIMGNVDALFIQDIKNAFITLAIDAVFIFFFFKEFKITTFDPNLSNSLGISAKFYNYLLMILTSATAISGFKAVGVLMILAFLVGPVLTARLLIHRLLPMIFLSIFFGISASLVGVAISRHLLTVYHMSFSTGGITVCTIVFLYCLAALFSPEQGLISKWTEQKKIKKKLEQA